MPRDATMRPQLYSNSIDFDRCQRSCHRNILLLDNRAPVNLMNVPQQLQLISSYPFMLALSQRRPRNHWAPVSLAVICCKLSQNSLFAFQLNESTTRTASRRTRKFGVISMFSKTDTGQRYLRYGYPAIIIIRPCAWALELNAHFHCIDIHNLKLCAIVSCVRLWCGSVCACSCVYWSCVSPRPERLINLKSVSGMEVYCQIWIN